MNVNAPQLVVFSTLFPHAGQPHAGVFIRERMFRVAHHVPLVVVAPVPWFPLQGLVRRWRPHFRPTAPGEEIQDGVRVLHPRFFSVPGMFKWLDGLFMALGSYRTVRSLCAQHDIQLIDSHFAYPDGYAATLLGRWFSLPVTITLRGTEPRHSRTPLIRAFVVKALQRAQHVISVSTSLKEQALALGIDTTKVTVVGNGVDAAKFRPMDVAEARSRWQLPAQDRYLITVGGLVERKGFHRVIELLPVLRERYPDLRYLIVGGGSAEGDWSAHLRELVHAAGLQDWVHFMGAVEHARLRELLSAADVFVLPTRNEGWANVILEAMACRLPVVTTDVGGNREVVANDALGAVVPFGDSKALETAILTALEKDWDRDGIQAYAEANSWDDRVERLLIIFKRLTNGMGKEACGASAP